MTDNKDDPAGVGGLNQSMQVGVLAHMLAEHRKKSETFLDALGELFELTVPAQVEITRGGWFWQSKRPVETMKVSFPDVEYEIKKTRQGIVAQNNKISKGIRLKSTDMPMEDCITQLVERLSALAETSAETKYALEKFVLGR